MLFLLLVMELKMVSPIGLSKTRGELIGASMGTLRWSGERTCVVSPSPINYEGFIFLDICTDK